MTDFNDNSSRFAKFLDLSFSKVGKVTGAKVSVFLLEHTRLLETESGLNRNFHVFSIIYCGLESLGRLADFGLHASSGKFECLDAEERSKKVEEFNKLVTAFKLIGFRENEMETIYRILSAILNLSEIQFKETLTKNNMDGSEIVNAKAEDGPAQVLF